MEYDTFPGQGICGEYSRGEHDQYGSVYIQVEGYQVGFQKQA